MSSPRILIKACGRGQSAWGRPTFGDTIALDTCMDQWNLARVLSENSLIAPVTLSRHKCFTDPYRHSTSQEQKQ